MHGRRSPSPARRGGQEVRTGAPEARRDDRPEAEESRPSCPDVTPAGRRRLAPKNTHPTQRSRRGWGKRPLPIPKARALRHIASRHTGVREPHRDWPAHGQAEAAAQGSEAPRYAALIRHVKSCSPVVTSRLARSKNRRAAPPRRFSIAFQVIEPATGRDSLEEGEHNGGR